MVSWRGYMLMTPMTCRPVFAAVSQTLSTPKPLSVPVKYYSHIERARFYPRMMNASASQIFWSVSSSLIWVQSTLCRTLMDHVGSVSRRLEASALLQHLQNRVVLAWILITGDIARWHSNTLAWNLWQIWASWLSRCLPACLFSQHTVDQVLFSLCLHYY